MVYEFGSNKHQRVFMLVVFFASAIACAASILQFALIYYMNVWNGHILLIKTLAICQFVYDVTFFTEMVNTEVVGLTLFSNFSQLFSGIAVGLTSNVIAFVAFYVIYYGKAFEIHKNYYLIMTVVLILSLLSPVVYIYGFCTDNDHTAKLAVLSYYFNVKNASVGLNFIFTIWTAWLIRVRQSGLKTRSKVDDAIFALSIRLIYYPIVQSFNRSGASWYEKEYGIDYQSGKGFSFDPEDVTSYQFAAQLTMALTMPIGSIGYLLIFLIMQPKAMLCCKQLITCQKIDLTSEAEKRNFSADVMEFAMDNNDNYDAHDIRSTSEDYYMNRESSSINSLTSVLLHEDGVEDSIFE